MMARCFGTSIALLALSLTGAALAQDYPAQPIKLLVGFSPGGGLDISCRHWAHGWEAASGSRSSSRTGRAPPARSP